MEQFWQAGITRLMLRMSVKDIAREVGLSESSIYDIKNGYSREPRGMAAVKLYRLIAANASDKAKEAA